MATHTKGRTNRSWNYQHITKAKTKMANMKMEQNFNCKLYLILDMLLIIGR
jgi:hypothetical protein